jgi:hypothetical protein
VPKVRRRGAPIMGKVTADAYKAADAVLALRSQPATKQLSEERSDKYAEQEKG